MRIVILLIGALLSVVIGAAPMGLKQYQESWLAPGFDLIDQAGVRHKLADYRGKVLVVNFWATWCSPCVKEMPSLQRTWEKLQPENVRIVGIAVSEDSSDISQFLEKQRIVFPLLADGDSLATERWRIPALPTTYVIDKEGYVVMRVIGPYEWDSPESVQRLRDVSQRK